VAFDTRRRRGRGSGPRIGRTRRRLLQHARNGHASAPVPRRLSRSSPLRAGRRSMFRSRRWRDGGTAESLRQSFACVTASCAAMTASRSLRDIRRAFAIVDRKRSSSSPTSAATSVRKALAGKLRQLTDPIGATRRIDCHTSDRFRPIEADDPGPGDGQTGGGVRFLRMLFRCD